MTSVSNRREEILGGETSRLLRACFLFLRWLTYYLCMAKRAQGQCSTQIYPLISPKERLAVWEKARGAWTRRSPDPIRET